MSDQAQAQAVTAHSYFSYGQRPTLRGVSHLLAAIAAIFGAPVLMLVAASPQAYVGGAVFAVSLILLYVTSASYHLIAWRMPTIRGIVRRLDHSMIFVLIAGTYTPFCLIVVDLAWGISTLSVVGAVAVAGILLKLLWPQAPKWLGVMCYVTIGWLGLVAAPEVVQELPTGPLILLVLGGALYTIGGIIYAAERPNLWPRVFGYHEVFHLFVIGGSALHYWLIMVYLLPS